MAKNKYVDFVSDEDFLECVEWVCNAYPEDVEERDMAKLQKNTLDPFKLIFDIFNAKINFGDWIKNEQIRQVDKKINNRVGDFHQKLLGKVNGWNDLGIGDSSKLDLINDEKTIFIELKNKENTVNSDSKDKVRDKLENAIESNPGSTAYWAFILSKRGDSGEKIWKYHGKEDDCVKMIWGKNVYKLITGDEDALKKVWKSLPIAVNDLINSDHKLSPKDEIELLKLFQESLKE